MVSFIAVNLISRLNFYTSSFKQQLLWWYALASITNKLKAKQAKTNKKHFKVL